MLTDAADLVAAAAGYRRRSRAPTATIARCSKEKDLDIVLIGTPDHWHALPMIAAVQGRGRRLCAEADQRRCGRRPGDARRRAQTRPRRAGRHAAPQHAALDRSARQDHQARASSARSGTSRSIATTTCGRAKNPPDIDAARESRLRNVDRPRADAALQQARPSAQLAGVHGIRQRHRRRHVHPHARHGPLDARPRLAQTHHFHRRHLRRQGEQGEHHRHADGDVRLRRLDTSSGNIAPGATRPIRSIPGARRSTATRERSRRASTATTSSRTAAAETDPPRRDAWSWSNIPRTRPRRIWKSTSRRRFAATCSDLLRCIASRSKPVADIEQGHITSASCILANLSLQLGRSLTWDAAAGRVHGDDEANKLLARPYRAPWVHPVA